MIQLVVKKYLLDYSHYDTKYPKTLKEWLDFPVKESDSYTWKIKAHNINKKLFCMYKACTRYEN